MPALQSGRLLGKTPYSRAPVGRLVEHVLRGGRSLFMLGPTRLGTLLFMCCCSALCVCLCSLSWRAGICSRICCGFGEKRRALLGTVLVFLCVCFCLLEELPFARQV